VFSARAAYHVISNGHRSVLYAADSAASALAVLAGNKSPWEVRRSAARYGDQCDLLRDIVGNPSRPITLDPSWRTSTVAALAQAIYEERTFERLPILADALEDSGCADQEILTHCRGPRLHIRGCWVVDLLLCKQ